MLTETKPASGRSVQAVATEIKRQSEAKADYLVQGNNLRMFQLEDHALAGLRFGNDNAHEMSDVAHSQLAEMLDIPGKYYNRLRYGAPELLSVNVNHWLEEIGDERKMLRTLDGKARAILSKSYKIVDHDAIFGDIMSYLHDAGATISTCEITDKKLYIRATFPIEGEVKLGDVVRAGVQISNSEVGQGAVNTQAWTYRITCLNGMVMHAEGMRARSLHLGGGYGMTDGEYRLYAEDTIKADAKAISLKTRDIIKQCADPALFDGMLKQMRAAAENELPAIAVGGMIGLLPKEFGITKSETIHALDHFIKGGNLDQWGLANAVTRVAQDVGGFDRRVELEEIGGKITAMTAKEFGVLGEKLSDVARGGKA